MANSIVIAAGSGTKTGSLKVSVNSDNPFYLCNIRHAKIKADGVGNAGTVVLLDTLSGQSYQWKYTDITTIGGLAPASLTDAVDKLAALIIE